MQAKEIDKKKIAVLWICAVLFSFLLSLKTTSSPFCHRMDYNDSPIYKYIGAALLQGKIPYIDIFDHKGIYFYFICAVGCFINIHWGAWLLLWIVTFGMVVCIYKTSRKFLGIKESIILTLCIGIGICATFWQGAIPDTYSLYASLLSLILVSDYFIKYNLSKRSLFLIGILSGTSFWIKPNMVLGPFILCFCIIVHMAILKRWSLIRDCFLIFFIGFIVASLPAVIWLQVHGAFNAMIEDYFLYNSRYISFYGTTTYRVIAFSFFVSRPEVFFALIGFIVILILSLRNSNQLHILKHSPLLWCGMVTFSLCLIEACLPGNDYQQYTLLLYPSLLILWIWLIRQYKTIFRNKRVLYLVAFVVIAITVTVDCAYAYRFGKEFYTKPEQEDEEIDYIKNITKNGDTIQVISPYYTGLYFATECPSATKYIYVQSNHFISIDLSEDHDIEWWNQFFTAIKNTSPRMLIVERNFKKEFEYITELLDNPFRDYKYVGCSNNLMFYVLPRNELEEVSDFSSDIELEDNSLLSFSISQEMIDAYKRGEITMDAFLDLFDKELFKETGIRQEKNR